MTTAEANNVLKDLAYDALELYQDLYNGGELNTEVIQDLLILQKHILNACQRTKTTIGLLRPGILEKTVTYTFN